jgi:hypothetical protein
VPEPGSSDSGAGGSGDGVELGVLLRVEDGVDDLVEDGVLLAVLLGVLEAVDDGLGVLEGVELGVLEGVEDGLGVDDGVLEGVELGVLDGVLDATEPSTAPIVPPSCPAVNKFPFCGVKAARMYVL